MAKFENRHLNKIVATQRKHNFFNFVSPGSRFWAKRIIKLIFELLFITWAVFTIVFILFNLIPYEPQAVTSGLQHATESEAEGIRQSIYEQLHLNGSIFNQYFWSIRVMFDGTMGLSWTDLQPVSSVLWGRMAISATIGFIAVILSLLIGIPVGIYLARRESKFSDFLASVISVIAFSIPSFVIALLLVGINSAIGLPFVFEYGNVFMYLLASLVIAIPVGFGYTRYLRTSIRQEYGEQYVALARVKGISEEKILTKHILKPALFPIINYFPFIVVGALFGSITIESVFAIPGTGKMLIDAALEHDQSSLLAITTVYTFFTVISFFIRDLLITFVDPRIKGE